MNHSPAHSAIPALAAGCRFSAQRRPFRIVSSHFVYLPFHPNSIKSTRDTQHTKPFIFCLFPNSSALMLFWDRNAPQTRSEEGTGACRRQWRKQAGGMSEIARSALRDYASFPESGACHRRWRKQAGGMSEIARSALRDYASFPESGACRRQRRKQAGGTSETARSALRDYASFPESGACRRQRRKQVGGTSETARSALCDYASFPESGACRRRWRNVGNRKEKRAPLRPEGLGGVSILPPSPFLTPLPPYKRSGLRP